MLERQQEQDPSARRAVPAGIRMVVLDRAGIVSLPAEQWDRLAHEVLVENPFHDRIQVLAALQTIDRKKAVKALAFYAGEELVGLFLYQKRSKVPSPLPVANIFHNDYLVHALPLIHRDHVKPVVEAWVRAVQSGAALGLWAFADVDTTSPVMRLIEAQAKATGLTMTSVLPYERAFLTRLDGGFDAHLNQVLSKNRLKDVRRTMRRLGEVGQISLEFAEEPALYQQRLEEFLALEHAGWKGEMGTSFLSHPEDAAFARAAYAPGLSSMASLLLDGKPIAMKLFIQTGDTAFSPKIAYDESYKKLGPGMALEYLLIEDFYANRRFEAVDAAATAEGHSALNFFNNQKPMATVILGRSGWHVALLARLHDARRALKVWVTAQKARRAEKVRPATEPEKA
ncbi:MAG: GNAT family N-acetyltransferase [Phyllobacteriaceae bacterium]|nr:GNAT family N-acetyltransferase [Phyllobacteriaceae bacterium]